jgi:hypothetical protein
MVRGPNLRVVEIMAAPVKDDPATSAGSLQRHHEGSDTELVVDVRQPDLPLGTLGPVEVRDPKFGVVTLKQPRPLPPKPIDNLFRQYTRRPQRPRPLKTAMLPQESQPDGEVSLGTSEQGMHVPRLQKAVAKDLVEDFDIPTL